MQRSKCDDGVRTTDAANVMTVGEMRTAGEIKKHADTENNDPRSCQSAFVMIVMVFRIGRQKHVALSQENRSRLSYSRREQENFILYYSVLVSTVFVTTHKGDIGFCALILHFDRK